jgi:hypothetical protein
VAPKADGSGLAVTVTLPLSRADQHALEATARMPLTISVGQRPQAMFSRQADVPLFWGGSRYNSPVGGCSNGFPLLVPGAPNVYMIRPAAPPGR